ALRAAGRWEEVAAEDPADETAQQAVMRARFAAGDRPGAGFAVERLSAALQPLGLRPGGETLSLPPPIAGGAAVHPRPAGRARRRSWSCRRRRWPSAPSCSRRAPTC